MILYAFVKDNVVTNIAVFDEEKSAEWLQNWATISHVDELVLVDSSVIIGATYANGVFTNPVIKGFDTEPQEGDPELRPDLAARTDPILHGE